MTTYTFPRLRMQNALIGQAANNDAALDQDNSHSAETGRALGLE